MRALVPLLEKKNPVASARNDVERTAQVRGAELCSFSAAADVLCGADVYQPGL